MSRRTTTDFSNEACGTLYASRMLGLSVATVQALVERGELTATRTKGGHRRIAMTSVREYLAQHGMKSGNQYFSSSFLKVLVVDDDPVTLELLRNAFEDWKLPVDCTVMSSAMEAVMDIGSIRPDLLISDLRMPGIDGFEFLRTVRNNSAFNQLMILVVTGLSEEEVAAKGGLPAHTQLIHKPLNLLWLQGYVTGLIGHKAMVTGIPMA